jgi:hypothetical protein
MEDFDLEKLSLGERKTEQHQKIKKPSQKRQIGRFLKGPIPLGWLSKAACLPGKALHVSIALRFLEGLKKDKRVALSNKVLEDFGVSRFAKARALKALEASELISVERGHGHNPVVTIISEEI